MAKYDETKFYWLVLKDDFFENDAIEWLEEQQPKGKEYAYFYLKLCLKALKTNGILIRQVGEIMIPYDEHKLAEITNTEFDTVVVAMELLKKIGLVKILDNKAIYLNGLEEMIGSQSKGAFKKQQQRLLKKNDNKRLLEAGVDKCPPSVPQVSAECPPKIEEEKEEEDEREKEKKIVSKDTCTSSTNCNPPKKPNETELVTEKWNEVAEETGLRGVYQLKKDSVRYKMLKRRIHDYGLENVIKAVESIKESQFLQGVNNRGWEITFDWFVRPNNFIKVLEGNYVERKQQQRKQEANDDMLEKAKEIIAARENGGN